MTRREVSGLLASVGFTLLAGCGVRRGQYRFRMTVEIETPQGVRSGSSVMEVTVNEAVVRVADSAHAGVKLEGEAVAVDLPGGTLFALLGDAASGRIIAFVATQAIVPGFMGGSDGFTEVAPKLMRMGNSAPAPLDARKLSAACTFSRHT